MSKMMMSYLTILITIILIFLQHPLSIGLMILLQTLMLSLMMGMLIKTYWFSYILFLTFLGGLLVLFIYVSAIASNEMFNMSINMKMIMILTTFIMIIMYMYIINNNKNELLNWLNLTNNIKDNDNFFNMLFFNNDNKINLNKLYNNYMMMMMLIIYLFISLLAIVKITNIFYGPLRSNYKTK